MTPNCHVTSPFIVCGCLIVDICVPTDAPEKKARPMLSLQVHLYHHFLLRHEKHENHEYGVTHVFRFVKLKSTGTQQMLSNRAK
jgi:hypothetical protein